VLGKLVDAGLLEGTSGPVGGYHLARSPRTITLLDIANAVEAPLEPMSLQPARRKHRRAMGAINRISKQMQARYKADLRKMTLAKLSRL